MAQSLTVNGKEYLPSNELALRHNYTPDYIAKLARDEKILATQIGRTWFIEPTSLESFLHQTQIEKNIRKEELSRQRKIEHSLHQKTERPPKLGSPISAVLQTALIALCGLFVGGLGYVATDAGLGAEEFALGIEHNARAIVSGIFHSDFERSGNTQVAASAESVSVTKRADVPVLRFTQLPEFPPREPIASSTSAELDALEIATEFSDEVRIQEHDDGVRLIVPVFRSGDGREFFLSPVVADQNEYAP